MRILGIDPGLAIVGWGIIDYRNGHLHPIAYGSVTTPAHTDVELRLEMIYNDVSDLIEKYKPDEMAIEELFFNTNRTTGISVAEARGVIILCARKHGVSVMEYTPLQVKQAVVGYGRAEKKQVIAMVTNLLQLKTAPKLDDTADALAIAICHAHTGTSRIRGYYNLK